MAAKVEELRVGAVSQGVEWLRRALSEISRDELPASRPGCCEWCGDTIQQEVAHCSRAAQRVDGNLGAPNGGWVRQKMGFNQTCIFDRS